MYELDIDKDKIKDVEQVDEDLKITLKDGTVIIFDNYFEICRSDLSCLVSVPDENGVHYAIDYTTANYSTEILSTSQATVEGESAMTYLLPFLGLGLGGGGGGSESGGGGGSESGGGVSQADYDSVTNMNAQQKAELALLKLLNDDLVANGGKTTDEIIAELTGEELDEISAEYVLTLFRNATLVEEADLDAARKFTGSDDSEFIMMPSSLRDVTIYGAGGNDIMIGGGFSDKFYGGEGDDVAFGYRGDEYFSGGAGDDYFHGGAGNDTLDGGDGNDVLEGGRGNDTMTGGAGADTFYYRHALSGHDTIRGFSTEDRDMIDLSSLNLDKNDIWLDGGTTAQDTDFFDIYIDINDDGDVFGNEDIRITLEGVNMGSFDHFADVYDFIEACVIL